MIARPSGDTRRGMVVCCVVLAFFSLVGSLRVSAQTQQPFLFATTQVNGSPAVATFTRNDASGALTEVANSPFVLRTPGCSPTTIDVSGRFLFGPCGVGIALYDFNSSTGAVAEVANSPFAASTGGTPSAVIAESTGQFVYVLKFTPATYPAPTTVTLDSFVIDTANNALSQPSTQTFTLPGTLLSIAADPNHHFLQIYMQASEGSADPVGQSCGIFFNLTTGLPEDPGTGLCQPGLGGGANPVGIAIDGKGVLLGTAARGQNLASFDVFAVSPADGSIQASGTFSFETINDFPTTPVFDPTGQIAYVNTDLTGLRIFGISVAQSTVTITELPSSPFPANQSFPALSGLPNPSADFMYVGGSDSITAYPIDTTTGYPGAPVQSNFSHSPVLNYQPFLASLPPSGQAVSAPAVLISTQSLNFGPINPGQTSGPQMVTISSTGNEALTISSLGFNPSAGPFSEVDTCMAHPLLAPGTSCTVSVSYAPTTTGTIQVGLVITDTAAGSPQAVTLSGTAVAPPPPAPAVTFVPGTLNFPGTTTQGTLSASQSINITNSGNAALTFSSAPALSGVNTADFSITANSCTGSLAPSAPCSVTIVFGPLAAGVRTTNLVLADNAANSPQSVTINGTATPSATIAAPAGASLSASVSAGQPAQFNLQATPGAGFNGTLTFACAGLPTGASCSAPNVMVANGATANFSLTVTTSGIGAMAPPLFPRIGARPTVYSAIPALMLLALAFALCMRTREMRALSPRRNPWPATAALACLALVFGGCGGGSGSSQSQSQVTTPTGTYTIAVTPSATASGSTKTLPMNAISLTLNVK
ncbi:MAG TPA: choice-of-anchor D domain-containing protein [Candidatus Acidoferrum sp.]|nr:choice-of-anchor D domain-containing protein [Candidatus Acidoferrum sp.]